MLTKAQLVERAAQRSEDPGDYWAGFAAMLKRKQSLERGSFTQKEWNWYQQAKAELTEPWD